MKNHKQKVVPLFFDTYLAVIKNSLGSKLFRNFYAAVDGRRTDITRKGELSCAFYVSSVLVLFKFIKEAHTTVDSTLKDLKKSGWREVKEPKPGSVLVWEKVDFGNNNIHKHIGFFIGGDRAISTSYRLGYPIKHHWTFGSKRNVEAILWHSGL